MQRIILLITLLACLLIFTAACSTLPAPAATPTMGISSPTIEQSATTANYKLKLALGDAEKMLTMDEAKTAKSGEVMVSGEMAMTMSGMSPNHHLEIQINDVRNGNLVTDKAISIQITNDATKEVQNVPIAIMYGVAEGPSDTHYGNNVTLMPGKYTILVTVGGETATFVVNV